MREGVSIKKLNEYLYYLALQDLKTYHYKTLLLLTKEPLTQSVVGNQLGVSKQNINKVFKQLEQGGYIEVDRIEGRNKFFRGILDIEKLVRVMPGQLKI